MEEYQAPLGDVFEASTPRVGERLRRARQEKGLELTDIARETRVPLRHLAALEGDAHDSLPALTYSIGFAKTFARAVGLPPEEIAAQFKAETNKVAHIPQTMPLEPLDESRVPPRGVVAVTALVVLVVIAGIWAYGSGMFNRNPPPPVPVAAALPADPVYEGDSATVATAAAPAGDIGVASASVAPLDAAAVAAAAGGPVVLTATTDVWIKIYDAQQQTVKMGILQPGESYQVPTDQGALQLWTGRAGALRITVGGREIPPLGAELETVQDVDLSPAALLARAG